MKDPYKALGVERTADSGDIKKAYRKLTREFHPDRNPGDKQAEERFKDISLAYDIVGDPDKRKLWDEFGEISLTQGFDPQRARAYKSAGGFPGAGPGAGPGGFRWDLGDVGDAREASFDDLLSRLFGGGRVRTDGDPFGRTRARRRGHDIAGTIKVSLLDSLHGVTVPLRVDGTSGESRTLDVKVPQGMPDGGKLRLRGQGGSGDPPGDILLTVDIKPGADLERDGMNLRTTLEVTALIAYRGGRVEVPTPWGAVTMSIPPGSQNGQTLRLRGRGVKAKGKEAGNLYVKLDVRLPPPGDEELERALERLQGDEAHAEAV